jgi:hypothetical protein
MSVPAIKSKNLSPDERSRAVSQGVKNYWDSPAGQEARKKQRERMMGNKIKSKVGEYIPPGPKRLHFDSPINGDGGYMGAEPGHTRAEPGSTEAPGAEVKPVKEIDATKFAKVWPQFLVRLHKSVERLGVVFEWGVNKVIMKRFFKKKRVRFEIDPFTKADAEAESELTDLLLEDGPARWVARHKVRAWFIWRATWIIGGTHIKLEDAPEEEKKNKETETFHAPGTKPSSAAGGERSAASITSSDFD